MARHALVLYAALTALLLTIATAHKAVAVKEWCVPPPLQHLTGLW